MTRCFNLFAIGWSAAALMLPSAAPESFGNLQTKEGSETLPLPRVACSADKPVVQEGDVVVLRAWAISPSGQAAEYSWSVGVGRINGKGQEVRWDFTAVRFNPHAYEATVNISLPAGVSATCSIQVIVAEKERGGRETGRSFLLKGQSEAEGYGLYSYLLLGTAPTDSNHERYLKTIEPYLRTIRDVTELQDYFQPSKLNVAYLPLQIAPLSNPSAEWVLDHYDYARARALLDLLPGNLREGPYIVSVLKPLGSGSLPKQYLFQNLSTVPTTDGNLISWWIREFLNQAAQERFWEAKTAELLVLKLRTTIEVLASGLPEVQKALDSWISWVRG